jgi:hypothetical protein
MSATRTISKPLNAYDTHTSDGTKRRPVSSTQHIVSADEVDGKRQSWASIFDFKKFPNQLNLDSRDDNRWGGHNEGIRHSIVNNDEQDMLPPVDGGKHAWAFVFGASIIDGVLWGNWTISAYKLPTNINRIRTHFWNISILLSQK